MNSSPCVHKRGKDPGKLPPGRQGRQTGKHRESFLPEVGSHEGELQEAVWVQETGNVIADLQEVQRRQL